MYGNVTWGFSVDKWKADYAAMNFDYTSQANGQYQRTNENLQRLFGSGVSADPDCNLIDSHCNFPLDCTSDNCPTTGRYRYGIHIECASGGYDCGDNDPKVVHDDTVSPWLGRDFQFSSIFTWNFWEHSIVDVGGGKFFVGAFPQ
jgi:hypothetical protein